MYEAISLLSFQLNIFVSVFFKILLYTRFTYLPFIFHFYLLSAFVHNFIF